VRRVLIILASIVAPTLYTAQVPIAALFGLLAFALAPAFAEYQGPNAGTDLYDRPVLAIDAGMHTAKIFSQAVDAAGRFAVTGSADHTVRVWSVVDGKLLRTIWIPVGPEDVGDVYAVTISPDGSMIAAGGWTERVHGAHPINLFKRESGDLVQRIGVDLPNITHFLTFSPDGRYLAATLGGKRGLRVFDRDKDWTEAFRDDQYGDDSYGAAFSSDGRLVTTSYDGLIRLYTSDANMQVQTEGEFGGVGLNLTQANGLIKVVRPLEDRPAAKAGMLSGDIITAIDDAPTQGLTLYQAVEKMRGAVNLPIKLTIVRGPTKEVKEFTIVRDLIRIQSVFRRVGEPVRASSGNHPSSVAFSPDNKLLAVGYDDVATVDVVDISTLRRAGSQSPSNVTISPDGLNNVAWSRDGRTLFSAGSVMDFDERFLLFSWDRDHLANERRMTYCADDTATGVAALPDRRILVASTAPCLGLMDARGELIWTVAPPTLDLRYQTDVMRVSRDGKVVDFGFRDLDNPVLRFDAGSLALSIPPPNDGLTFAPNPEGLTVDGWQDQTNPTLDGRALPFAKHDIARSLAVAPDAKRFFLGSMDALTAFDGAGTQKWRQPTRDEIWAVNASKDGRVVVTADGSGAIRWRRADDGRELLALQVLPNKESDPAKWDWVLWTPEGFYEATPGAENVLKWVVNHGPDQAATTLPVSAIAKLHRPNALPHVLDQLETAHALGVDDMTQARLDVQAKTGSAKPPGGVLHVLTIGVDKFGDKAGGLRLDYAAEDAHDVASALLDSQKGGAGKASLYADVSLTYLPNDKADSAAILDALDAMAQAMAKSGSDQDVAVILVSSHGEMIDGQFYFIPYGFDAGSQGRSVKSAVSASEFAKKIAALAAHGKVLVLLDACHSGAVGAQDWAKDPDAKVLEDAMDMENVTVLTSSKKNELSEELPEWRHGALAEAFLDALRGAADSQGVVKLSALTDAMENEVQSLTKGKQHLRMHVNFSGDLFVAAHY
jgi:WD40 repeat protein